MTVVHHTEPVKVLPRVGVGAVQHKLVHEAYAGSVAVEHAAPALVVPEQPLDAYGLHLEVLLVEGVDVHDLLAHHVHAVDAQLPHLQDGGLGRAPLAAHVDAHDVEVVVRALVGVRVLRLPDRSALVELRSAEERALQLSGPL
jgi:hypothetical protein